MNPSPPPFSTSSGKDVEHLNLLAIFHYVVAGLAVLGMGFLFLHYLIFSTIMNNPAIWQAQKTQPPLSPQQFFAIFQWVYLIMGGCLLLAAVGNFLSGWYLRQRMNRTFSLVVAGLDCLQVPFGTVLGVFTIIVLMRESVRQLYQSGE